MRAIVGALALGVAIVGQGAAQTPSLSLCTFSGRERSALAWQSAVGSFNTRGGRYSRGAAWRYRHIVLAEISVVSPATSDVASSVKPMSKE